MSPESVLVGAEEARGKPVETAVAATSNTPETVTEMSAVNSHCWCCGGSGFDK